MFQTYVVEKIKTHVSFSVPFSENRTLYEIMSENLLETEGPQMTKWRMRVACYMHLRACICPRVRVPTCTHARTQAHACTHRPIINTCCFSTARVIRERASVLRYTYITCSFFSLFFSLPRPHTAQQAFFKMCFGG
jgi:hypothetical protein